MKRSRRWFSAAIVGLFGGCTARSAPNPGENGSNTDSTTDSDEPEPVSDNSTTSLDFPATYEFDVEPSMMGDGVRVTPVYATLRREMDVFRESADEIVAETFDPPLWSVHIDVEARHEAVTLPKPSEYVLLDGDGEPITNASRGAFRDTAGVSRADLRFDTPVMTGFKTVPGPEDRLLTTGYETFRKLTFAAPVSDVAAVGVARLDDPAKRLRWGVSFGD